MKRPALNRRALALCKFHIWLLYFVGSHCHQAPAGSSHGYRPGTEYRYEYSTTVLLNDPPATNYSVSRNTGKEVGYKVTGEVVVDCVWQNPRYSWEYVLQLKVENPQLSVKSRTAPNPEGFKSHSSPLDSFESTPIYVYVKDTLIRKIYAPSTEAVSSLNLKRGIASLFMIQGLAGETKELDASGQCRVRYEYTGDHSVKKTKWECSYLRPSQTFASPHQLFGVSEQNEIETNYDLSSNSKVIENVSTKEVRTIRVTARQQAGVSVFSSQTLKLTGETSSANEIEAESATDAVEAASKKLGLRYIEDSLQLDEEHFGCSGVTCKTLASAVQDLRSFLKDTNVATRKATEAFMILLKILRRAAKEDILPVLRDAKNKNILPQLLDVLAAAQTRDAHQSAMEVLNFEAKSTIDLPERYLLGVALSTHPSEYLLQDLYSLAQKEIPSEKLMESTLLTLASVTKTFSSFSGNALKQIVTDVKELMTSRLGECRKEVCRNMYLRALKNLAMSETASVLLGYVDSKDRKTAVAAINALKSLPGEPAEVDLREKMLRVYLQLGKRYDSSARTLALDILLDKYPSEEVLRLILETLKVRGNKELATYTLQRVAEYAARCPTVLQNLGHVMRDPTINNYHVLAQGGLSTVLSRNFFADSSVDASYSSSTEMAGSMLKRSAFDVYLTNAQGRFELLSFGLFAGGLSSFTSSSSSSSSSDEPDDEDATAGMEISLAGVQLRPIVFFTGQGELMGHVWSGTGSERTSALQATVLLQDTRKVIPLHNGFTAVLDLQGAVSFDFAGQIQISLWNRNAHSLVENVAAVLLDGSLQIGTSFVRSEVDFRVNAEMKVEFSTDTDFYNDLTMCLQMNLPKFSLTHSVEKQESIPGTKHRIHKGKKKIVPVPGRSFALNRKNDEQCRVMFHES